MASTEELEAQILAEMESNPEAYADTGIEYCTVDDDTRVVTIPEKYKKFGVESDEKAKRVWFRFPKLVGNNGIDLSAISVRVNFRNANGDGDIYMVEDLTVDGDYVVFSWELSRKVTAYKGHISFVVCAVKSSTTGVVKNEWNTTLNKDCEVLEGLEVTEQIAQENPDIIEYILANLGGSVSAEEIATAVEAYLSENPPSGMTADEKAQLQKNTEDISSLSEEMANVGRPTDEQVSNAVNAYLEENGVEVGTTAWKGKRLSVLGTSISTYPDTIPDGYECYYTAETMPSVDDMWWKKLCNSLEMELLINNSYSGSCVAKRSSVTIPSGSETVRNMALDDGENAPDVIIVEMGTNDFLVSVSVGSYSVSNGETFDSYSFKGAYAKMLWNILCRYPNSKVYCTTIMPLYQGTDGIPFPTSKSAGGIEAYNDAIETVANMFGVEVIELNKCGITAANLVNYTVDGRIHPNANGQTLMANMAENALSKFTPVLAAYIDTTVEGDSTEDSGGDSGETGDATLLHSFDFTTGKTTDSVGGLELTASNVTFDSNGALFSQGKSQLELADAFDVKGKTLVLEFGDMDGSGLATTTFHNTWRVFTIGHNTFRASGLSWNTDTNKWNMTQASVANTIYEFDGTVNELANGTLKIVIDSSGNGKIYFNDVLKRECPSLVGNSVYIDIGKIDGTFYSMTVKKFEIYSNNT